MFLNRISSAALITCAIMGVSASAVSTAQAASSSATASQRPAASHSAPLCEYSSAVLGFFYWVPPADTNLAWSSTSSTSGNAVLLGIKKYTSPLDCFKIYGYVYNGRPADTLTQNNSSLCLNVAGNSKAAGAWIILYDCVSSPNEKFYINFVDNETQLQSVSSGLCIDAGNGLVALSHIVQEPCSKQGSNANQEWNETDH
jgi:hypothetical protein